MSDDTKPLGLEPVPQKYRPTAPTIEAFSFNGTFPLGFLRADETVRRAAAGGSAIVVTQQNHEVVVNLGEYLVRNLVTGSLRKESSRDWFCKWEPA